MNEPTTLTRDQVETYRRDGYLVVRAAFDDDEVADIVRESQRLFEDREMVDEANLRAYTRASVTGETVVDRFDPVRDISPLFAQLTDDPRTMGAARDLMGGPVYLFKDKIIAKFPGVSGYSLHQDFTFWQAAGIPPDDIITAYVTVDPATRASGALEFVLGHHERLLTRPGVMEDVDEADLDMSRAVLCETQPGDVVFFHTLVPHRSAPNTSDRPRRLLYFSYSHARHGDVYERYYETYRVRRLNELPEDVQKRAYFR